MIASVESYFDTHQIYDAVVYEIFNNNFGEEEEANSDEEVKGAPGLLRGLESNWRKKRMTKNSSVPQNCHCSSFVND